MISILGIDPGEINTAWTLVMEGEIIRGGMTEGWKGLAGLINNLRPQVVVAESFRLYPHKAKAQYGNRMMTARVLGVIEFVCQQLKIRYVEQQASRIRHDPLLRDIRMKNKHMSDAAKHAMAYWYSNYTDVYDAKRSTT